MHAVLVSLKKSFTQFSVALSKNSLKAADLGIMPVILDLTTLDLLLQKPLLANKLLYAVLRLPLEGRAGLGNKTSNGNGDGNMSALYSVFILIIQIDHLGGKLVDSQYILIGFRGKSVHEIQLN